jgi:lipopolysaccharide transport system permease protein
VPNLSDHPSRDVFDTTGTEDVAAALARKSQTVIEPRQGWKSIGFNELWRFRELLYFLTWRDIKVRYKQSILGVTWAIIQPLTYMFVFTLVFGQMAGVASDGIPYPLFAFTALLPWTFFAAGITQSGQSIVSSSALITKIYFPRLAIPIASVCAATFDFCVSLTALVAMVLYYVFTGDGSVSLGWQLLFVPALLLLVVLAALGVGAFLAALSVAYRDFKHAIPFLVQLWMFATPAIYMGMSHVESSSNATTEASTAVTESQSVAATGSDEISPKLDRGSDDHGAENSGSRRLANMLRLNPLNGLIYAFRSALLGSPIPWLDLGYSTAVIISLFFGGCLYFRHVEDGFSDII